MELSLQHYWSPTGIGASSLLFPIYINDINCVISNRKISGAHSQFRRLYIRSTPRFNTPLLVQTPDVFRLLAGLG